MGRAWRDLERPRQIRECERSIAAPKNVNDTEGLGQSTRHYSISEAGSTRSTMIRSDPELSPLPLEPSDSGLPLRGDGGRIQLESKRVLDIGRSRS
jgi:hypothetical protein